MTAKSCFGKSTGFKELIRNGRFDKIGDMLPFRQINQSRYAARFSFSAFALAFFLTAGDAGAGSEEDFRAVEAFPNLKFERPVHLLAAPDGSDRLFLVEQEGRVLS